MGLLNPAERRQCASVGILLLGLLGLAGMLTPNSSGMGTHQQLGLPPCTFNAILGVRCPTCGMTTSWSHLMHGDLAASWRANPGGTCLALVTVSGGLWAIAAALRGVASPHLPRAAALATVFAIVAVTLIDWVAKVL